MVIDKIAFGILAVALAYPQPSFVARTFERVLLLETKGETSASVSLGDIDGDGDLDVILAKGRHWPLVDLVLRNDGKGHFSTEKLSETADRTYSAALADLDGDGDLDIAVSNDRPDKKLIYRNDGKGHFTLTSEFGDPTWPTRYITVADLNGDQRPDILVANRSSKPELPRPSFFCLNDGKGAFPKCTSLPTQSATIVVAADLDGDDFLDLLIPHRDGGQSLVFWNDGKANFSAPMAFGPAHSSIRAAEAADLVFTCGPLMAHLHAALPAANRGGHAVDSAALAPIVAEALRPGDAVLVKGSLGSQMRFIIQAIDRPFCGPVCSGEAA